MQLNQEKDKPFDIVIVIPTLNEEKGLEKTIKAINEILQKKYYYKILVVDGLSTDNTVKVAEELGAKVIKQRRKGYGDALQTGFYYVDTRMKSEITAMIDADGTYEPRDIEKMIKIIQSGKADFVIGNRFKDMKKGSMTRLNKFGNKILSAISSTLLHLDISDTQCGLRAFRSDLANIFYTTSIGMPFATDMLVAAKTYHIKIKEIPTSYYKRIGEATLNPIHDGARILSTIIKLVRDTRPLALFGLIGLICIVIGIFSGLEIVSEYIETGKVVRIPTTILSALLIVLGVQSISLGLLSDMLKSRTFDKRIFYNE